MKVIITGAGGYIGAENSRLAQQYTWENYTAKLIEEYEKITRKKTNS